MMDTQDHRFEKGKVLLTLGGSAGAKAYEHFTHPVDFVMELTMADWAVLFALIYSFMQVVMAFPKFFKTVRGFFHGIF